MQSNFLFEQRLSLSNEKCNDTINDVIFKSQNFVLDSDSLKILNGFIKNDKRQLLKWLLQRMGQEKLIADLYGEAHNVASTHKDLEAQLIKEFKKLNQYYQYFHQKISQQKDHFINYFLAISLNLLSHKRQLDHEAILTLAYKTLVLFGDAPPARPFGSINHYCQTHNIRYGKKTMDEILNFQLPINTIGKGFELSPWRKFIRLGPQAVRIFQSAFFILERFHQVPDNLNTGFMLLAQCQFKRYAENPEVARRICELDLDVSLFEKILTFAAHANMQDVLPDYTIKKDKLTFQRLKKNDPNIYFIGDLIDNCLAVGKQGEVYISDILCYDTHTLYVLMKHGDVLGAGMVWWSEDENITIDDWHNLRSSDNELVSSILKNFAQWVTQNTKAFCVTIGGIDSFGFATECQHPETLLRGFQGNDSLQQTLVYIDSNKVTKIQEEIVEDIIPRMHQLGFFNHLFKKDEFQRAILNHRITTGNTIQWLNALFCGPHCLELWLSCLQNIDAQDFLNAIQKESSLFFKVLYKLQQHNVLDSSSLKIITENSKALTALNFALKELADANILNATHIALCLDNLQDLKNLSLMLNHLNHVEMLTEAVFQTLIKNRPSAHLITEGLVLLKKIPSPKEFIPLLLSHPADVHSLAFGLNILSNIKDPDVRIYQMLDKHPSDAVLIAKAYRFYYENNLSKVISFDSLTGNLKMLSSILHAIVQLPFELQADKSIQKLLIDYPHHAQVIAESILFLLNENLPMEYIDYITVSPPSADVIVQAIKKLDDEGIEITHLTEVINRHPKQALAFADALSLLNEHNLINESTLEILKKNMTILPETANNIIKNYYGSSADNQLKFMVPDTHKKDNKGMNFLFEFDSKKKN